MTPCDAYTSGLKSLHANVLDSYVHITKCRPDTKYKTTPTQTVLNSSRLESHYAAELERYERNENN